MRRLSISIAFLSFFIIFSSFSDGRKVVNDPSDQKFSYDDAFPFLMYSYAATCQPTDIKTWGCYWCKNAKTPLVKPIAFLSGENSDVFGFVGVTPTYAFFAYRGSANVWNWVDNFLAWPYVPFHDEIPNAWVHDGFFRDYLSIRQQVLDASDILRKNYPNLPIITTGHSLGGALAVFTAADLRISNKTSQPINIWSFGCPRVGNKGFADYLNSNFVHRRSVNQRDLVPHLPMKSIGYLHDNTEYWFPTNGTSWVKCPQTEQPDCSDSVWDYHIWDHLKYLGVDINPGFNYNCM
eukprot:TRINITY_DN8965_c0_g1_i1.p1 TRINITY_DN8965_c0_g1~~TRINITY_DN8965_c0_g1_i1.p1  ORF type:complete len:305 (-),score=60.66 TRINITY_DN8965_c0_g1_i1:14-892(-)